MFSNVVWVNILIYLPWKKVIQLSRISKSFNRLIKLYHWPHLIRFRNIKSSKRLKLVTQTYHFTRISLRSGYLTDDQLELLRYCHSVNLFFCTKITDDGIKHLSLCQEVLAEGSIYHYAKT